MGGSPQQYRTAPRDQGAGRARPGLVARGDCLSPLTVGSPWDNCGLPHQVTLELLFLSSKPGRGEGRSLVLFTCQKQQGRSVVFIVCETFTITTVQKRCVKRCVFQAYGCWESEAELRCCAKTRIRLSWFKLPLNGIIW